jgi:hypothetical protein
MQSGQLLSDLQTHVQTIVSTVLKDFKSLDHDALNYKTGAEQWSVLECFEHLNRYARFYVPEFERAIQTNAVASGDREHRSTWLGKKFISMMHPDNMKKSKTLKHMNPLRGTLNSSVIDEFVSYQERLLQVLKHAEQKNLRSIKIPVEFFQLLKMNIGDALQFVIVHELRHLIQAKNALKTVLHEDGVLQI